MKTLALLLLLVTSPALGASHFVRQGANGSGTGADWTNAFTAMPSSFVRGDTYYVADGSYSGFSFSPGGTALITIKKCTSSDHGTDTGYQSSYCASQAIFTSEIDFSTGNVLIDGITGGGPATWRSGHGFKITGSAGTKGIRIDAGSASTNITVRHMEITHNLSTSVDNDDGIYVITQYSNLTMQYMWFHDMGRTCILTGEDNGGGNVLLEYSVCERQHSGSAHGEGWADQGTSNVTVRYNLFWDNAGTAAISVIGRSLNGLTADNWQIYGNIFGQTSGNPNGAGVAAVLWCGMGSPVGEYCTNWYFLNNTIVGMTASNSPGGIQMGPQPVISTPRYYENNLWVSNASTINISANANDVYNSNAYFGDSPSITDLNKQILASNPIANWTSGSYTLAGPTNAGVNTSALVPGNSTDMFGNTRGGDGVWDRGALEFGSGSSTRPSPPSNLAAIVH